LTHYSAPLTVRESYALSADSIQALRKRILGEDDIQECVFLNTCNRVEVYIVFTNDSSYEKAIAHFCHFHDVEISYLKQYLSCELAESSVYHLFAVAAGLDSQVPGETEILGQVKQAYQHAVDMEDTGAMLNQVFSKKFSGCEVDTNKHQYRERAYKRGQYRCRSGHTYFRRP